MKSAEWNRIRSHFGAILDLTPAERGIALDRLDRSDPEAAAEVRRLIANFEEARSFLDDPVMGSWQGSFPEMPRRALAAGGLVAGRYEIRHMLGAGGMGEVYEVWDREMRMAVALKVLPRELALRPEMVDRFLKEVYLAREVAHPGVCKTFDLGRNGPGEAPLFFLTMELVDGETLAERLRRTSITPAEGELILMEVVEAVAAAHTLNVIHRDLKPGNVMVRRQPLPSGHRVVIMDFGLAKGDVPDSFDQNTGTQQMLGTPQYMAPEQLANEGVTKATDVYALGLIAYEVLTGRRPLHQDPPLAALIKRAKSVPPEPRSVVGSISARWNAVIARCLQPDPLERFSDAGQLLQALTSGRNLHSRVPLRFPFSRRQLGMWSAGAVAATVAGWQVWRTTRTGAFVASGTRLLLMPVVNGTGDTALDGVGVSFGAEIQQSSHLAFRQPEDYPEELNLILKRPGELLDARRARHLALRTGIPLVLFATLGRVGSEYVFDLALERVDPATERAAASWPASFRAAGQERIHSALFDAARWLRRTTGESESTITDLGKRPEEVTTDSWEALREFSLAQTQAETDLPGAVVTLAAAVRRDPLFAMAHMRRGDYLVRLNRFAEGYEAWRAAMHAMDQRPISRREELMIRAMYADDMQAIPEAVNYYRELMRIYPYVDYPWRYVSSPLMKMGRLEESIEIVRQLIARTGGTRWSYWRKLLDYSAIAGHNSDARAAWDEMKRRQPPSGETELAAFVLHASAGEHAAAEQSIREALAKLPEANRSKYTLTYAHWLADRQRFAEAAQLLHAGLAADERAGRDSERARKLVSWAAIETRIVGPKPAKTACLEALELDRGPQRVRRAAVILARNGFVGEASKAAELLDVAGGEPLALVAKAVVAAEIHLARADFAKAKTVLQPVVPLRSHTDARMEHARALAGTKQIEDAVRLLEDTLKYRHSEWAAADLAVPMDYLDARELLQKLQVK